MIKKYAATGIIDAMNCVNKETDQKGIQTMSIRLYDKAGVLSHVFSVLAKNGWNVQEMENIVFKAREACVCNISYTGDIAKANDVLKEILSNKDILNCSINSAKL